MGKKVTEKQLIEILRRGYDKDHPNFPWSYEYARKHESGDGLAEFIVIEAIEASEGCTENVEAAHAALKRAAIQLESVVAELERNF